MTDTKPSVEPTSKTEHLSISNRALLINPLPTITESIEGFLAQPLPVLARLALRKVANACLEQAKLLQEAHLALMQKQGGTEVGQGNWQMKMTDPSWPAYFAEFQELASATFEVPITEKVHIPNKILYRGAMIDVIMDGVAATVLESVMEITE